MRAARLFLLTQDNNRGMITFIERIDQALQDTGCHYDVAKEQFMDGERPLELEDLAELLPEVSLDELASYQDAKWGELLAAQQRTSQADK